MSEPLTKDKTARQIYDEVRAIGYKVADEKYVRVSEVASAVRLLRERTVCLCDGSDRIIGRTVKFCFEQHPHLVKLDWKDIQEVLGGVEK